MNEVLKQGSHEDKVFEGRTVFDFDGSIEEVSVFQGCKFEGAGHFNGSYAAFCPAERRPFAMFRECTFTNADKAALMQWAWFEDCIFTDCEDGIFDKGQMRLHIERCQFYGMGTSTPAYHPDCIQTGGGLDCKYMMVKNNTFDIPGGNSWCFIETAFGPVSDVRIIGNRGGKSGGPTYDIYLWDDKFGAPKRCWVDHNEWDDHAARVPVAYNFAGGEAMIGERNRRAT